MQKLKNKIQSQTGASLTFALLIFLVCAVIGSAVLVAGTAASGRMSKMAESDQRYYSVNSAARLLIELMQKDKIQYEAEKGESATTYTYKVNLGTADEKTVESTYSLGVELADLVLKMTTADADVEGPAAQKLPLVMQPNDGEDLPGKLNINGYVTINKWVGENSADLQFEVTSWDKLYTLNVYFTNTAPPPSFEWTLDHIESVEHETAAPSESPTSGEGGGT